jgi:hypothetical protein
VRAVVLLAVVGCGFQRGAASSSDDATPIDVASGSDARTIDAPTDARPLDGPPDAYVCTTHTLPPAVNVDPMTWKAKFLTSPIWTCNTAGSITINSMAGTVMSSGCSIGTPDVTADVAQTSGGAHVMVVRLRGLSLTNGAVLQMIGTRPIILLVAGNVTVDSGALVTADASGTTAGPGAATCADQASGLGITGGGGWGGGGGGFGTAGGQGGYNTTNGGAPVANTLVPLRGGCAGGATGGSSVVAGGGGAFEISATGTISIGATSAANLSAGGGGGPITTSGGAGGASGGGILLVSPAPAAFGANGAMRANGGAGSSGNAASGAGGTNLAGENGHATDSNAALDTSGVAGGSSNDHGRAGGLSQLVGATPTLTAGATSGTTMNGRGGGGGGGGFVVIASGVTTMSCD